jgi:hypothetical protein|tara:strand:+ start:2175 stop:3128 length:954 start_codon:yes stop_codon:yes gene_type:complete
MANWKKYGKIFDPTHFEVFSYCNEFAQSPQVLQLDNGFRVYYSTREPDETGKFLSHIAYVDFDKEFSKILGKAENPIIALGELGTFDEHGIFPINPLQVGNEVYAYSCGWSRRKSVSVETSTGLAVSKDGGKTFLKNGLGPVFSSSLNEPFLVGDSFVKIFNNKFHMWYIYGLRWMENSQEEPARVYKIAHAISDDGISWERNGKLCIPDKIGEDECQALPSVEFYKDQYHMVFCYRAAIGFRTDPSKGYRLGYAISNDGINWKRNDDFGGVDTPSGEWDRNMRCYPHLFCKNGDLFLLYNGNQFGKYGFGLAKLED